MQFNLYPQVLNLSNGDLLMLYQASSGALKTVNYTDLAQLILASGGLVIPFVTPEDYGAVGDGIADDTLPITSAITNAGVNGLVIFSRGKTYLTTDFIVIPNNGVTILGNGATITSQVYNQYRKFRILGITGVTIRDLKFLCLYSSGANLLTEGVIDIDQALDTTVTGCSFSDVVNVGIRIAGGCFNTIVKECRFSNNFCSIFVDDGLGGLYPIDTTITGNQIVDGSASSSVDYSGGIKVSSASSINGSMRMVISNNTITNPGQMGIEVQSYVNDIAITGNTVIGAGYGISVSNCTRVAVSGNAVKNIVNYGIEISSGCEQISVTGNTVDCTDTSGSIVSTAAILVEGTTGGQVTGNCIKLGKIHIQSANGVSVSGNSITCYLSGVYIQLSNKVSVTGNTFIADASSQNAIVIDVSGSSGVYNGFVISGNTFVGTYAFSIARTLSTAGSAVIEALTLTGNDTSNAIGAGNAFDEQFSGSTSYTRMVKVTNNNGGKINGTLGSGGYNQSNFDFPTWSTDYTTVEMYRISQLLCNATAGNIAKTLPDASRFWGMEISFQKSDSSGHTVTISTTGGQTINGAATVVLAAQYDRVTVKSDGSNWIITQSN